MGYKEVYDSWKADPEAFWMAQAEAIDWDSKPSKALFDKGDDLYEWFADSMVNTCWNAVDRHVEGGRGDQIAIIHDSPITQSKHQITYAELRDRVASLAGALRAKGIEKGDRVIIYMPMIPEAVEAMLACSPGSVQSTRWSSAVLRRSELGGSHRRRQTQVRSSPPPAGSSRGAWSTTNRCLTARMEQSRATSRISA